MDKNLYYKKYKKYKQKCKHSAGTNNYSDEESQEYQDYINNLKSDMISKTNEYNEIRLLSSTTNNQEKKISKFAKQKATYNYKSRYNKADFYKTPPTYPTIEVINKNIEIARRNKDISTEKRLILERDKNYKTIIDKDNILYTECMDLLEKKQKELDLLKKQTTSIKCVMPKCKNNKKTTLLELPKRQKVLDIYLYKLVSNKVINMNVSFFSSINERYDDIQMCYDMCDNDPRPKYIESGYNAKDGPCYKNCHITSIVDDNYIDIETFVADINNI